MSLIQRITLVSAIAGVGFATLGFAAPANAADDAAKAPSATTATEVERYCSNIAEPAREERYRRQKKALDDLRAAIDTRMTALEKRKGEYEDWLKRRDDFVKSARQRLVDIYTNMDADAAADQLSLIDPSVAAAILMKLKSDRAGAILNEMKAEKAARLAAIIASAGDPKTSGSAS
ncbi:MotE family protein [Pararhizobium mangrovi]|uniref:Flagellar protein n=1 Tax=Pararhizobium mangrovi TaxID=2590452 RepID=A0A506TXV1_9HYPH|nr:MotE family protein [Pararhizobium mangrovi]TPW26892.1 flagellar protein [Pararhizobium mangrovi]